MTRGLTLVEMLIAIASTAVLLGALAFSFSAAHSWQAASERYASDLEKGAPFEDGIRRLLASAYLTSDTADATSYFIASSSQGVSDSADTITFTRIADSPSSRALSDTQDFDVRNDKYGVLGGLEEVSLSQTAVGQDAQGEGLFVRRQRPSDGEPTQGGRESLYSANLAEISYEFYDGQTWQTVWDTRSTSPRRLPSAVRITYRLNDEDSSRIFVVPLKHSDATSDNPAVLESTSG